jgi:DNA-binding transcriptional regulator GbsR (MarR family)
MALNRRVRAGQEVLTYMTANADKPLVASEIADALNMNVMQVSNAVTHMIPNFPNIQRIQRGVYKWNSTVTEKPQEPETELIVKIVDRKADGTLLVTDETSVYVMRKLDW